MSNSQLYIGANPVNGAVEGGKGEFVIIDGEPWFKIIGVDAMDTFFMTIVSSSNHWMFIASNGGITAGRKNAENALFPYYTDDKVIDNHEITGSKTIIKASQQQKTLLWEPFSERYAGVYKIKRNLYKNKYGSKIKFEEVNEDLKLVYRYTFTFSEKYGLVKFSEIENLSSIDCTIELLDGLQNLLPYGVNSAIQNARSTLVDAYKKNELIEQSGLGVFSLSSMIVDKAEPSEALSATTVWSKGLDQTQFLLSTNQLNDFRLGKSIKQEGFTKAVKAAYFVHTAFKLESKQNKCWCIVAEVNQSSADVIDLNTALISDKKIVTKLNDDVEENTKQLIRLVGLADGLQMTADKVSTTRHYSNVLFNIMRGGIFEDQYAIDLPDLKKYVRSINSGLYEDSKRFFESLPEKITYKGLLTLARDTGNIHLSRICTEYLPLSFSRRHGDPSRPWNTFSIELQDEDGTKKHNYEGNWRDIFQNWEALAFAFPEFIIGKLTKFVNASTVDGYNPYRITRQGIDWEIIEPDDPWSYIGYWGDHQIIYLQKLMEHAEKHFPGMLDKMLSEKNFVFANVPYKIKGYQAILKNPNDTIDFDHEQQAAAINLSGVIGADGKLVWRDRRIVTANFAEKLLVMVLTKLYNFIPDGGIWLNTQRPEWNDANNALVGNGLSMVTLNYLSRCMHFLEGLFAKSNKEEFELHSAVAELLNAECRIFKEAPEHFDSQSRKQFMDDMGLAGESYRTKAYNHFQEGNIPVAKHKIVKLLQLSRKYIDRTIEGSKRDDGLYHAYNLLHIDREGATISTLYEMLEGQVASISSGLQKPEEVVAVLDVLKKSEMYREDQFSYMLYPNRSLATFNEKNNIPQRYVDESVVLTALKQLPNNGLIETDVNGEVHFAGHLHNAQDVHQALQRIKDVTDIMVPVKETALILAAFEQVFNHVAFTGRSGTFYGYEGLGSIYWHMVSKLLLAVQENIQWAQKANADKKVIGKLIEHYYEIRAGIGINKEPGLYGAFPTDAYSHTPEGAGAQQPGLTGQVKEDVINRWAELGLEIINGELGISPGFLHMEEFLSNNEVFEYVNTHGQFTSVEIEKEQLAFTYCGILFIYRKSSKGLISIQYTNGEKDEVEGLTLPMQISQQVFERTKAIEKIIVDITFES